MPVNSEASIPFCSSLFVTSLPLSPASTKRLVLSEPTKAALPELPLAKVQNLNGTTWHRPY
jgi:hypothetical protein